ncbi:hypothetical protein [Weissella viridescens]|uniref:hypothetical protein n=1 Tax=Weissella viridescens TaxID=1629 RepID=UPI0035275B00
MQIIEQVKLDGAYGKTRNGEYEFELTYESEERVITMKKINNPLVWWIDSTNATYLRWAYFMHPDAEQGLIEVTW